MRIILDFVESDIFHYNQGCYLHCPDTNKELIIESDYKYPSDRRAECISRINQFINENINFTSNEGFTNIDNYIEK